jgi:hypothetical protein
MDDTLTLADFFSPDYEKLPVQIVAGIDQTPDLAGVKALLTLKLSGAQWATLVHVAAGKVRELLRVPLTTILGRAWKDLKEVREAVETTRKAPGRTEVVALADHSVESEHKPYLDLYEGGKRIGRITFPISLEIELRGLLLEIETGAIRKIASGDARVKGTLKIGDVTLVEKAFERVRLPGEVPIDTVAADRSV